MHPEVVSDKPGKCPKCGGMDLTIRDQGSEIRDQKAEIHDHSSMMAGPNAAGDFLRRFFIVTAILPLLFLAPFPLLKFAFATAIFYFGLVFFQHARHEWMAKKYGMMTLVSLAVGSGYLFSAASTFIPAISTEFYLEISTLIWILLFGHFLEAKSSTAAGDALKEVAKLLPKKAHKIGVRGQRSEIRDQRSEIRGQRSEVRDVDIEGLKAGDRVLVKPGEKVPADGVIAQGFANFNESHLTGESRPVKKQVKDRVVAGAICLDGSVEVVIDKVGAGSTIGQIQELIRQARQTKPTAQKIADKAAGILTFTALAVGIISLLFWSLIAGQPFVFAMTLAITVLVIACPHALGLAIPTVSTIATTLAVKNGIFLKDLAKLEVIKNATYVVFDKTGTLTTGRFGVASLRAEGRQTSRSVAIPSSKLLQTAASLESHSSHVIGQSIVKYAKDKKISLQKVTNFKNFAGKGVAGAIAGKSYILGNRSLMESRNLLDDKIIRQFDDLSKSGSTVVALADAKNILGFIVLSDQVKPESKSAVAALHGLGVKVAMLTGDSRQVADAVAKNLNIDTAFAQVLPQDKYLYIKKLQQQGNTVLMVGDGVNDAPALTQADAGVAIAAGTDVAVEAGDVVLTRNNPQDAVRLIALSRQVYRKMVENLVWAVGYNVAAIPAAAGLFIPWGFRLTPGIGAILMSLSSVIVVLNALSLRRVKLTVTSPTEKENIVETTYGMLADVEPQRSWTQELVDERRRDNTREETKFDSLFNKKIGIIKKSRS